MNAELWVQNFFNSFPTNTYYIEIVYHIPNRAVKKSDYFGVCLEV